MDIAEETQAVENTTHDGCPRCDMPIPLPLQNFCTNCQYPLRSDSWERAARLRRERNRRRR